MSDPLDYKAVNKALWNNKVDIHYKSEFYNNENFIKGESSLNDIELDILNDVMGKSLLHLQCHFGQDTISFARLGAIPTGADLSDKAIMKARELNDLVKMNAKFVCSDVYDLPEKLDETFDIVFTSYGTIGWLPDINKWAEVVSHFLKKGGKFLIVDFHPVVWMYDDNFTKVSYNYFNDEAIVETIEGTYADKDSTIRNKSISWNHSLSEIISSLLNQGLRIDLFKEYDYSPYDCFEETYKVAEKKYRLKPFKNKIPMIYAIQASKV